MNALLTKVHGRNSLWLCLLVFALALAIGAVIVQHIEKKALELERLRAGYTANIQAGKVQYVLNNLLYVTRTLEALLREGDGKIRNFDEVMPIVTADLKLRNVALAPGGVINQVSPLKGNEAALGHDLFTDPTRNFEAELAKKSRNLTLSGPFALRQGGFGAAGRLPVFLRDKDDKETFWGLVCVTLEFPQALEAAGLNKLEESGVAYELWRIHPNTKQKQVIMRSQEALVGEPVEQSFDLPNSQWTLSVVPVGGWRNKGNFWLGLLIVLLIAALLAIAFKSVLDLAAQRRLLEKLSLTDPLTGLPNRRALFERLERYLNHCFGKDWKLALCYIDIDGFKWVNDSLGHEAGDSLLIAVAQRLRGCMANPDNLARIGGDEFVFLHQYDTDEELKSFLASVEAQMETPFVLGDVNLPVSLSMGISCYPCDGKTADQLIHCADQLMYQMKKRQKAQQQQQEQQQTA